MSAEAVLLNHPDLAKAVYEILVLCKDLELPGKAPNLDDDRVIAAYVAALVCNGIDANILKQATGALMSDLEFYPRPSNLKNACIPFRDRAMEERREIVWANPKLIEDELGNLTAVIGERALPKPIGEQERPISDLVKRLAMRPMPAPISAKSREYDPIPVDEEEEERKRSQIEILRRSRRDG